MCHISTWPKRLSSNLLLRKRHDRHMIGSVFVCVFVFVFLDKPLTCISPAIDSIVQDRILCQPFDRCFCNIGLSYQQLIFRLIHSPQWFRNIPNRSLRSHGPGLCYQWPALAVNVAKMPKKNTDFLNMRLFQIEFCGLYPRFNIIENMEIWRLCAKQSYQTASWLWTLDFPINNITNFQLLKKLEHFIETNVEIWCA